MEQPKTKNQALKTLLHCREEFSPVELQFLEKTRKYSKYVAWIPGLRLLAVCNSIAMKNAEDDSDIDLFIVTDPRRMWLVRVLVTLTFQILGVRRHGKKTTGRFCLSFFATTQGMDLSAIVLKGTVNSGFGIVDGKEEGIQLKTKNQELCTIHDPYLSYWVETLIPIIDLYGAYAEFRGVNSMWTEGIHSSEFGILDGKMKESHSIKNQKLGTKNSFLDFLDRLCEKLLKPKTLREFERLGRPWGVIISDNMLKFHPRDKRREIAERL